MKRALQWLVWLWLGCLPAVGADTVQKVFEQAAAALASGDYATAERGFTAVLKAEPANVAALSNLGVLYSRTERASEAIRIYKLALKSAPNDKAILLNLGLVHLRREEHARALPLFRRVVELDPRNAQARQLLALCRAYTGELEPAIRELESLHAAAPQDEGLLFLLGLAYLKHHDGAKARVVFDQMFSTAGPAKTRFLLGKASYEAALFADAEESYLAVAKIEPDYPGLQLELGKVYISQHRDEEAERALQAAVKQQATDADAHYFLGAQLVQMNRFADAVPHLELAMRAKPDFWAPLFYLAKAKLRLDAAGEAVTLLQRAAKLNPDEATVYFLLGRALTAAGRADEAKAAYARVKAIQATTRNAVKPDDGKIAGAR